MKNEVIFKLDMSKASDRKLLGKYMKALVTQVMANGNYLTDISVDSEIDEVSNCDYGKGRVVLAHVVKRTDIVLSFDFYGRKRSPCSEGNQ
jgi:hypothetical protein